MKIAIIAWGSLVWDPRELEVADTFRPIGPGLPVEFCRVSADKRLTLIIDDMIGAHCETYSVMSAFEDIDSARENLRVRERMHHINGVGFVDLVSGTASFRAKERHPRAVETIIAWADANGHDAAIWTALASNFHEPEKAGEPFLIEAAIRYLDRLDASGIDAALKYVRQAPNEIQTPVRAAVNTRWPEG